MGIRYLSQNSVGFPIRLVRCSLYFLLVFILLLVSGYSHTQSRIPFLEEISVLPIDGPEFNQPSGLFMRNDTLYTVSDKHDDTIYRIQIEPDRAVLVPHLRFKAANPSSIFSLDFEGITRDDAGNYYLLSEGTFAILKIEAEGGKTAWITPNLRKAGEAVGLFQARGGYLEGITFLGENRFLVSAERQPCGLIEIDTEVSQKVVKIVNHGSENSYTGLYKEGEDIFFLQRGSATIRKRSRYLDADAESTIWSFAHIVNKPEYLYKNRRFGATTAEGLAMDHDKVYVILDNNNDGRRMYPSDRRPLLLVMQRPS